MNPTKRVLADALSTHANTSAVAVQWTLKSPLKTGSFSTPMAVAPSKQNRIRSSSNTFHGTLPTPVSQARMTLQGAVQTRFHCASTWATETLPTTFNCSRILRGSAVNSSQAGHERTSARTTTRRGTAEHSSDCLLCRPSFSTCDFVEYKRLP